MNIIKNVAYVLSSDSAFSFFHFDDAKILRTVKSSQIFMYHGS